VRIQFHVLVYTEYIQMRMVVVLLNQEQKKGLVYMTTATVRKWGNSLAVRIPQEVSELVKFTDGVEIEMYVTENKEVLLRTAFPAADDQEALRKHFLSLRTKCKPDMVVHDEMFAEPMGDEII
jgi:antitoxin MazE